MHPAPDTTASTGHLENGPLGGLAAAATAPANSATATAVAFRFEMYRMILSSEWQGPGRLAGAPEPDEGERSRWIEDGTHREDPGAWAVEPRAATNQRAGEAAEAVCARRAVAPETTQIVACEGDAYDGGMRRPVCAVVREVTPVGHPLLDVPHHVERAPARLAARA